MSANPHAPPSAVVSSPPDPSRDVPPSGNESSRSLRHVDSARIFQESWHVYRTVLENNELAHLTTIDSIARDLAVVGSGSTRLLDLGCGDGAIVSAVFDKLKAQSSDVSLVKYTGVDASRAALDLNAVDAGCRDLIEAELQSFLATSSDRCSHDVVLANLILHHFDPEGKRIIVRQIADRLVDGGTFYYGDVYALEGEDRDAMLRRWKPRIDEFKGLTPDEVASVWEHIAEKDFPSTVRFMSEAMQQAGLTVEVLFSDEFYVTLLKGTKTTESTEKTETTI